MRALARNLLPFGLVMARRRYRQWRRLGLSRWRSWRYSWGQGGERLMAQASLALLPDRALAHALYVVDVGASTGEWLASLTKVADLSGALAIEPLPERAQQLTERFAAWPQIKIVQGAAGAVAAQVQLNRTVADHNASLRQPVEAVENLYGGGFAVSEQLTVSQYCLDDLLSDQQDVDLLKIDVQGYEAEVLAGATAVLKRTRFVLIEVLFYQHYHGDSLFWPLKERLEQAGFVLANFEPPYLVKGVAMFSNALFCNQAFQSQRYKEQWL